VRRAGNGGKRAPVVEMTHEQIAVELSTAREVVSRLLRDFERTGAVELARGRVHVRDPNALQALVS
jgi:CRP/FNR family transcriptional regulator, anaerobic regulatory protein